MQAEVWRGCWYTSGLVREEAFPVFILKVKLEGRKQVLWYQVLSVFATYNTTETVTDLRSTWRKAIPTDFFQEKNLATFLVQKTVSIFRGQQNHKQCSLYSII